MTGRSVEAGAHAWIDAGAGVAGDMLLGALIDAGADLEVVQNAVDLVIPRSVRLDRTPVTRAGQRATRIDVAVLVDDPPHRTWTTIRDLLEKSDLSSTTRDRALAVFARLAEAEARVHGIPPADVHFHEVGALDSLADVIGVCAAMAALDIATVSASEVAVGSGRMVTAHGDLPVPVPAVTQLAVGWRVLAGGRGELATPTGMALVTSLAARCETLPPLRIDAIGVGAGTKDTVGRANVTRVIIGERSVVDVQHDDDAALLLETNVDDLDPRLWPGVLVRLLQAGAADAWLTPILMKKGRPAHTLQVLCDPAHGDVLRQLIFTETPTFGIREHTVRKHALARAWCDVEIAGGDTVDVKLAHRNGSIVQVTPEFDTVTAVAEHRLEPAGVVLDAAITAASNAGLHVGAVLPRGARSTREPSPGVGASPAEKWPTKSPTLVHGISNR